MRKPINAVLEFTSLVALVVVIGGWWVATPGAQHPHARQEVAHARR